MKHLVFAGAMMVAASAHATSLMDMDNVYLTEGTAYHITVANSAGVPFPQADVTWRWAGTPGNATVTQDATGLWLTGSRPNAFKTLDVFVTGGHSRALDNTGTPAPNAEQLLNQ